MNENITETPESTTGNHPAAGIDLVDLAAVLFKWKWLILLVVIFFGALALGASLLLPKTYTAATVLEIGQFQIENEIRQVESPEAAADRARVIARRVFENYPQNQAGFTVQNDLRIMPKQESGLLELELEGPENSRVLDFLSVVDQAIIGDHARILNVERQRIKSRIRNLESRMEEYGGKKASFEKHLEALEKEEKFLSEQLEVAEESIERILTLRLEGGVQASKDPMAQLLFFNEMQRIQQHKDWLTTRLNAKIPRERQGIKSSIQGLESDLQIAKNQLEVARTRKENFINTQVMLAPDFSRQPASPRLKLNIALGLAAGLAAGVFLALLLDFWLRNRAKIRRRS